MWLTNVQIAAIFLTVFIGYCVYWFLQQPNCKGPFSLPFVGTPSFYPNANDNNTWFHEMTIKYGSTWTAALPGLGTFVVVTDPESVEYVLKTNFENFIKGPQWQERFQEVLGEGIFNVDGKQWKMQRKTASHMFNAKTITEFMLPIFIEHAHEVIALLPTKAGGPVDLQEIFFRYTLESISKIAFGKALGSISKESQDFNEALRNDNITGSTFGKAFDAAQGATTWRFLYPMWKERRLFQTSTESQLSLAVKILNKYAGDLIKERRTEGDLENKKDVLSWFMLLTDDEGKLYSDDFLRDIIMNFMIAGRDTTANCLTWTFHLLSQHPDCLQKLRDEVKEHGLDTPGAAPTFAQLKSMKYTEAVVKETLRLYPSVPRDLKMCVRDDVLPDGTQVRAGQHVAYLPFAQGRSEKLWGKEANFPHDADVFYPDRWLKDDFKPNAFYYPVFQAGLRTCLGKDMALLEAKTLTVMLVTAFDFTPLPGQSPKVANSIACPMEGGLHGTMTQRK